MEAEEVELLAEAEAVAFESVVGEVVDSGVSFGWDGSAASSVAWARLFSRLFRSASRRFRAFLSLSVSAATDGEAFESVVGWMVESVASIGLDGSTAGSFA